MPSDQLSSGEDFDSCIDVGEQMDTESDESSLLISPGQVRFRSLPRTLPSEKESCSIDNINKLEQKVTINDFLLLKTLASGGYGKVILSRKKNTNDLFAIKVLEIEMMKQKNCQETILNEKAILNGLNTDFITRGVYTFKSKKFLYMVMEFMKGGDLANLLETYGCFDEGMAQYYIAQLVLALEQLHKGGVIHRDLKPDNLLIDKLGHLKLTDFGLSEAGLESKNQYKSLVEKIEVDVGMLQKAQRVNSLDNISNCIQEQLENADAKHQEQFEEDLISSPLGLLK